MQTAVRPSTQILAALSKQKLTEKAKAKIIADGFAQIENYIDFDSLATKADLNKVELTLTKEIENTKLEIKNLEVKLTKEIEEIKREIANTKLEIKNLDVKITEIDKRFEMSASSVDKRFNMLMVLVGGGFTLLTVLITIYKFMS